MIVAVPVGVTVGVLLGVEVDVQVVDFLADERIFTEAAQDLVPGCPLAHKPQLAVSLPLLFGLFFA